MGEILFEYSFTLVFFPFASIPKRKMFHPPRNPLRPSTAEWFSSHPTLEITVPSGGKSQLPSKSLTGPNLVGWNLTFIRVYWISHLSCLARNLALFDVHGPVLVPLGFWRQRAGFDEPSSQGSWACSQSLRTTTSCILEISCFEVGPVGTTKVAYIFLKHPERCGCQLHAVAWWLQHTKEPFVNFLNTCERAAKAPCSSFAARRDSVLFSRF